MENLAYGQTTSIEHFIMWLAYHHRGCGIRRISEKDRTWIEKYNIHLVVHGDDYPPEYQEEVYKVPMEMGIFRVVPYTGGISTTEIIRRCQQAKLS